MLTFMEEDDGGAAVRLWRNGLKSVNADAVGRAKLEPS